MGKRGRPSEGVDAISVRIPKEIVRKLRVIASIRGSTIPKVLGPILEPALDREFAKALKEASANGRGTLARPSL